MFDQLHDPNPPTATSHHLAVVAERAVGMRRRRTAAIASVAAVGLLAVGAVSVAAVQRGDEETPLANAQLPVVDSPTVTELEAAPLPVPTTTVLDPSDLPIAVPVTPDPADLPLAVPVDDPDDSTGAGDASDDGASPNATESSDVDGDTDVETEMDTESAGGVGDPATEPDDADDADSNVVDPAGVEPSATAALRADHPIRAVTADGSVAWFTGEGDAMRIAGGDRLSFLGDGSAVVSSGSSLDVVTTDGRQLLRATVGAAAVDPAGERVAAIAADGASIVLFEGIGLDGVETERAVAFDRDGIVGVDTMWLDETTLLVLGRALDAPTITFVEPSSGSVRTIEIDALDESAGLRFAGRSSAGVVVHDPGTAVHHVLAPTDAENPTRLELAAPVRSIWFDGDSVIAVDLDGVLTV
ncbi:MAG: hypothetical protein AAGG08_15155, partial [Actinomycetota bacterium]